MSRPARYEYAGGVYYIRSRGKGIETIFREEGDRLSFLDILSETVSRFKWLCHSYCLLNDHYHLILETPRGNLSRGMRQINGLYTQMFNRKYQRKGPLFRDRFKSIIFEKTLYLLPLNRHMILNPVRAGLSRDPESWQWSSYLPTIEKKSSPPFLFTHTILSRFSPVNRELAIERYKEFISVGKQEKFSWRDLRFQVFLGSDSFIEKIKKMILVQKIERRDKTPSVENGYWVPLEVIMGQGWASRKGRDALIYQAYIQQGYTLQEIARFLGVHTATVSRAVRRTEKRMFRSRLR
jgi:REP element-mobilizing transposase RayT